MKSISRGHDHGKLIVLHVICIQGGELWMLLEHMNLSHFCGAAIKILEMDDVTGRAFLKTTKQDFQDMDIKADSALLFTDFARNIEVKKFRSEERRVGKECRS